MSLTPASTDPNYKAETERKKKDPHSFADVPVGSEKFPKDFDSSKSKLKNKKS